MTVYSASALSTRVIWTESIEQIWQNLPRGGQNLPNWKRPDLGLSEQLFYWSRAQSAKRTAVLGHH